MENGYEYVKKGTYQVHGVTVIVIDFEPQATKDNGLMFWFVFSMMSMVNSKHLDSRATLNLSIFNYNPSVDFAANDRLFGSVANGIIPYDPGPGVTVTSDGLTIFAVVLST